ncbi:MAG TPA: RagB/SusD family nutrient uptake outer membrane protein [Prolixibacteraceae bacterium]|nr:RagB/SusD family nutrient uptake outer membrane protein [Prolixibacteraceae bacterium]
MKKIKYFLLMVAVTVALVSCDSLDLSPEDYYGSNNFWNSEPQVKGFVLGQHSQLRGSALTLWLLGEARGGLQKNGTSSVNTSLDYSSPFKDQDFRSDKTGLGSWAGFYGRILNLNLAIKKVENECPFLTQESRNFYLGQFYGLRAYNYFWLYRTYGGVPLNTETMIIDGVTTAEPLYMERATPKVTLDLIKSDIDKSIAAFGANLSMPDGAATWTKFASLMLKAEVYLWSAKVTTGDQSPASGDLAVAEAALAEVENAKKFSLQANYTDVFAYNKKNNAEIIFALRFLDNEASNSAANFTYASNDATFVGNKFSKTLKLLGDTLNQKGTGILRNEYVFSLFESYDDLDKRKTATFFDFYNKSNANPPEPINGGIVMRKFHGLINSNGVRVYADDIPMYRYADLLLMMAEIENKKGGDPARYINQVRQRAFGTNYVPAIHGYVNGSFAANELAILTERDKEFVWEMKRWFDVLRLQDAQGKPLVFSSTLPYGVRIPVLDPATESHKVLWPVDLNTINADPKLKQTPGY